MLFCTVSMYTCIFKMVLNVCLLLEKLVFRKNDLFCGTVFTTAFFCTKDFSLQERLKIMPFGATAEKNTTCILYYRTCTHAYMCGISPMLLYIEVTITGLQKSFADFQGLIASL